MQRTEPELERSATEQLAKENGPTCFVVVDSGGQKLAYVYFEDEPGRRHRR